MMSDKRYKFYSDGLASESLHILRQAVEQSPSSIVITDLDAHIVYANPTFVKLSGYELDEVLGRNPRLLQSGNTPKDTYEELWSKLRNGLSWRGELHNRRKDGSEYIEQALISPVRNPQGEVTHYLAIKDDITERKQAEQQIRQLAHYDPLTGLPNRVLLGERVRFALRLAKRTRGKLAVIFLDLDHFKHINDSLGHSVGDRLLKAVSERLLEQLRDIDTVSRMGGDEFILLLPDTDAEGASSVAKRLNQALMRPVQIDAKSLLITASLGIAIYPSDGEDEDTLFRHADAAMYEVKNSTRNDYRFFTRQMQVHLSRRMSLHHGLAEALAEEQFELYFQPQFALRPDDCGAEVAPRLVGAEALLRWHHPELGMVPPAEFLPVAEEGGQSVAIGQWVLQQALKQMQHWRRSGSSIEMVAVNLSAAQFRDATLVDKIAALLQSLDLPGNCLELELTEAVAMADADQAAQRITALQALGVQITIDDFGVGLSSLQRMQAYHIGKLKLDISFIRAMMDDEQNQRMVAAIIQLGRALQLTVVAEGVETKQQLALLKDQGCERVQGFLLGRPLSAADWSAQLAKTPIEGRS